MAYHWHAIISNESASTAFSIVAQKSTGEVAKEFHVLHSHFSPQHSQGDAMLMSIGMNSGKVMQLANWRYLFFKCLRWTFLTLALCLMLMGCSSSSSDDEEAVVTLSGLWVGETIENIGAVSTTLESYILFFNELVYILRSDEAQVGSYEIEDASHSNLTLDVHPYAGSDDINQFYVGSFNNLNLTLDALFASSNDLVVNYNSITRAGRMTLELDVDQQLDLGLDRVTGEWDTTDATMNVASDGGFSGWNAATSCQWEGTLIPLTSNILTLEIERENCTLFNTLTQGLALIDGEGILHFIANAPPDVLWMRFDPVAAAVVTEPVEATE